MKEFEITENHLKLIKSLYINEYYSDGDYGPFEISTNVKRPFGNSDQLGDAYAIVYGESVDTTMRGMFGNDSVEVEWLDFFEQVSVGRDAYERLVKLAGELPLVMQICTSRLAFETGIYRKTNDYDALSWHKVK